MDCVYAPELSTDFKEISIQGDESKHLKALRLDEGASLLVTNGSGLTAFTSIKKKSKDFYLLEIERFESSYCEAEKVVTLAMPILDNRDRFEFALEKAVELGIKHFIPFYSQFCQRKTINHQRLEKKAIAAMKQSNRSIMPIIDKPKSLRKLSETFSSYKTVLLADFDAYNVFNLKIEFPALCIVGPEGGFTTEELSFLKSMSNVHTFFLGNSILRSETASIALLSLVFFNE